MSNLLQQDSLTIAELDSVASLCASLCLADATATSGNRLLDPIASALGAESAAYRLVDLQAVPRIRTLISVGAPASVSDSYLADFYRDDPTLHLLQQGQHAMAAAALVGAERTHAAHQHRHLRHAEAQQVGAIDQHLRR